jgi:hypothetical protein
VETWAMAELGTRGTIERVPVGHSRLRLRAPQFYPADRREAYGNVNYGGTRIPPHLPKGCVSETLHLTLRASYFYPDGAADKAAI